jgi:hypothetical protein
VCDVPVQESGVVVENEVVFGDPNNPTRIINYQYQVIREKNVATGYTVTDRDHFTYFFEIPQNLLIIRGQTGNTTAHSPARVATTEEASFRSAHVER